MKTLLFTIAILAALPVRAADSPPFSPASFQLALPRPTQPAFLDNPSIENLRWEASTAGIPRRTTNLVVSHQPRFVPVALYQNRPEIVGNEGRRAANLLHDHHIDFVFADPTGVMLAVPVDKAPEALRLLAMAIQAEHWRVDLVRWNAAGDWGVPIKPETILDPNWKP
jgi:hypothetical protein